MRYLIFSTLMYFLPTALFSQQFAYLAEVRHICAGQTTGYAEFDIIGDADDYFYYWEHNDEESLFQDNLPAGQYTFVVINAFGCREEYLVDILAVDGCTATIQVLPGDIECEKRLFVEVFGGAGSQPIEEAALEITWSDGYIGGLERVVPVPFGPVSVQYCVQIEIPNIDGINCCVQNLCATITGNPNCKRAGRPQVIVNETNRAADGEEQFVELLVIGDGDCSDSFDIRGFILDDNNGDLIGGSAFLSGVNNYQIGIDPGFLVFPYQSVWEAAPHGSLIVIYNPLGRKHPGLPPDDPTDVNQDRVYVLPATEDYFQAKTGVWNEGEKRLEYLGLLAVAGWEKAGISAQADGIQVRYPNGDYCHGISLGGNAYSIDNGFPLYLSLLAPEDKNVALTGPDYLNKLDFQVHNAQDSLQSPGAANSAANQAMIDSLVQCEARVNTREEETSGGVEGEIDARISVFPNPAYGLFHIRYESPWEGSCVIILRTLAGVEVGRKNVSAVSGTGVWDWSVQAIPTGGVYLIEVVFPAGAKRIAKIGIIK